MRSGPFTPRTGDAVYVNQTGLNCFDLPIDQDVCAEATMQIMCMIKLHISDPSQRIHELIACSYKLKKNEEHTDRDGQSSSVLGCWVRQVFHQIYWFTSVRIYDVSTASSFPSTADSTEVHPFNEDEPLSSWGVFTIRAYELRCDKSREHPHHVLHKFSFWAENVDWGENCTDQETRSVLRHKLGTTPQTTPQMCLISFKCHDTFMTL